ncbi:MAG: 30S ribosomal protein S11 [Caldiserica bacterium]|nr:30S ribosomal protein S11 [Caldisericota bacterium]
MADINIKKKVVKRKKEKRVVGEWKAYVFSSFNNTLVTITDAQGDTVCWGSSGSAGFKGSKKGTPFAAQVAAQKAAEKAIAMGMSRVSVFVKGAGSGREIAVRALQSAGLNVSSIKDVTPIPHNGCRPRKIRRV